MQSENINELAKALSLAQGAITSAEKDAVNLFFRSRYATIDSIWTVIRGPLSNNGLAVAQVPREREGVLVLRTVLMHESGQWIASELPLAPEKEGIQGLGSTLTYLRRYALAAIVGASSDEDTDGEQVPPKQPTQQQVPSKQVTETTLIERAWNKVQTETGNYYSHKVHMLNAYKKATGFDGWPGISSADMKHWKEAIDLLVNYAKEQSEAPKPEGAQNLDDHFGPVDPYARQAAFEGMSENESKSHYSDEVPF